MNAEEFVSRIRLAVVVENMAIYRKTFTETPVTRPTDPYWKRALSFFNELNPEQQEVFFQIIRQVAVDTTSNILGVIDGVNLIDGVDGDFELIYQDGSKLNGDLQSLFLIEDEFASQKGPQASN